MLKIGNNKYKALAKDTLIFAVGNFGTKIIAFLCVSLYTSYLTTEEYGTADILNETVNLLVPVMSLAISEAILRFMYDKNVSRENVYGVGVRFVLFSSLIVSAITLLLSLFWIPLNAYKWFFIAIFTLSNIESLFGNLTKGLGKSAVFAAKGVLHSAVFVASNILLLTVFHMGLKGYFLSYIISYVVSSSYMFFFAGIYKMNAFQAIDVRLMKNMLKYSIPFIPATISWWINGSMDKYMILWMIGAGANGLYGVAQKIPTIITMVTGIFTQAWQLSAMQNYTEDDFGDFFSEMFRLFCTVMAWGGCVILLLNQLLATFLFQNDFYQAWKYVPMLTLAAILSTAAGFLASAFTSAKKTNMLFVSTLAGAIVNLVINYFLIQWLGVFGATVATVISFFCVVVIRLITMRKFIKLTVCYTKYLVTFLLLFAAALVAPWVQHYYLVMGAISLVVAGIHFNDLLIAVKSIVKKFIIKEKRS